MNATLKNLTVDEKLAVIQLGYQLIGCAKQGIPVSEEDDPTIDFMLEALGLGCNENIGNLMFNEGANKNPYESFNIVSQFSASEKSAFKSMILGMCSPDLAGYTITRILRNDIANQIFRRVGIV